LGGVQSTQQLDAKKPALLITVEATFRITSKLSHVMSNTVKALNQITTTLSTASPFGTFTRESRIPFPRFNLKVKFKKIFKLESIEFIQNNLDWKSIALFKLLRKKLK